MDKRLLFISYFLIGAVANVVMIVLPLFFKAKAIPELQIIILMSSVYLASIGQPFLGYITDTKFGPIKMLRISSVALIFTSVALFITTNFYLLFILSFTLAFFRNSMFPMLDNITTSYCADYNENYGTIRIGGSIGFGLGFFLTIPLITFFGNTSTILLILILGFILFLILGLVKYRPHSNSHVDHYKSDLNFLLRSKVFILVVIINVFVLGLNALKLTFQTMLLENMNTSVYFFAILNVLLIVPEVIFLPYTTRIFRRFRIESILIIVIGLSMLHTMLIFISTTPQMILLFSGIHGLIIAIYIPHFLTYLKSVIPPKVSSTAFLISATTQMLMSFVIIVAFLIPVYLVFENIRYIFFAITILLAISIIPILILYNINNKKRLD